MQLRAPSYPLITIDPYFSVWSPADIPTDVNTTHWTGRDISMSIIANIDGVSYRLVGTYNSETIPAAKCVSADCSAFSTTYQFIQSGVKLSLIFTSPVIPNDLYMLSRPVSYLEVKKELCDRSRHNVSINIMMSEEICMNHKGDDSVVVEEFSLGQISSIKMGRTIQNVLKENGDDLRIDWGYFYLSGSGLLPEGTKSLSVGVFCPEVRRL